MMFSGCKHPFKYWVDFIYLFSGIIYAKNQMFNLQQIKKNSLKCCLIQINHIEFQTISAEIAYLYININ